jgi:hypothetical protein
MWPSADVDIEARETEPRPTSGRWTQPEKGSAVRCDGCGQLTCRRYAAQSSVMSDHASITTTAASGPVTRAVEIVLDPSPSQERWLRSYMGSMRAAYNWALAEVRDKLEIRRDERDGGIAEDGMTPALSWSRASLTSRWREVRDEVHPWLRKTRWSSTSHHT